MTGRGHACVVGYGSVGRLHARALADLGLTVSVLDPEPSRLPDPPVTWWRSIGHVPDARDVDVWVVCTPTHTHLPVVASVLARDAAARIVVEKPACRAAELAEFTDLLDARPAARVVVMDQYRYASALSSMARLVAREAPGEPIRALRVVFAKDRRPDVARGRFVDRDHGVFGYEWLHMLAALGHFLPATGYDAYLRGPVAPGALRVAPDPELVLSAAHERTPVGGVEVELFSTVVGEGAEPALPRPAWTRDFPRAIGERQRLVRVETASAHFTAELEPLGGPLREQVRRDVHRITVRTPAGDRRLEVVDPLLRNAWTGMLASLSAATCPPPDLRTLHRIASLIGVVWPRTADAALVGADRAGRPSRAGRESVFSPRQESA
ncbi:Gfo/Idh/MocA family oxidoreductase [Streptomyces sp. FH025]|uniref:Gfo/Idh/MocA family oxidoreductase n=1 Tax=Streptomyces sp. FH025 TaxID=2815937 RepID=UPI001A9E233E|nr:Gfo/Idh/MocA family oxidoreductase [Streptomyces sp. FH025]MBO1413657.1 Gfo/Idh/MocA family oxidoreductase [Streptomyces sp. FH025]